MSKFVDKAGTTWDTELTVGAVSRVERDTGVNLAEIEHGQLSWLETVLTNRRKLVEILFVVCESQCKAAGIEPEDFADRFNGPTIESAAEALAGSVFDFFQRSKVAGAMKAKLSTMWAAMDSQAAERISAVSTDLNSPSPAPESAELTPPG